MNSDPVYIIGVGGVGSWLAHSLVRLAAPREVVLVDGDTLEMANLDRQLFADDQVGMNKAEALADTLECSFISQYLTFSADYIKCGMLICCADNNAARVTVLDIVDRDVTECIIAANETHSAEAYYYQPEWKAGILDPRIYIPELITLNDGDPTQRGAGCIAAMRRTPQLVSANFMAAALALHLFMLWQIKRRQLSWEAREAFPYRLRSNMTRMETFRVKDARELERRAV